MIYSSKKGGNMKLSKKLYDYRVSLGISQTQAGEKLGIVKNTYCNLENGRYKHKLTPQFIGRIAKYLNCEPKEVARMNREDIK